VGAVSKKISLSGIVENTRAQTSMAAVSQVNRLIALKALLRDLESTKVIYPAGLNILALKHDLRKKIAELESMQRTAVEE
jgi:hypothetical protein